MATRKRSIAEAVNWTVSTAAAAALIVLSLSRPSLAYNDCSASTTLEGSGNLTSPEFPDFYLPNKTCIWVLTAEPGKVIRLLIRSLELEYNYDYLEIYDGTSLSTDKQLDSLTGTLSTAYESTFSTSITLVFTSDDSNGRKGFQVFFDSVYPPGSSASAPQTCGSVLRNSAVITTPNYPNTYPKDTVCTWSLIAEDGKVVRLRFKDFDLGTARDSLTVLSDISESGVATSSWYTGTVVPPVLLLGPEATLVFNSTGVLQYGGFLLAFTSACESALDDEGNITSPNYPDDYPSFVTCLWELRARGGSTVIITFNSFDLEPDDSVEVYSHDNVLIARYTGRNTTGGFSTLFGDYTVTLAFYGNTEDARKGGFSATFESTDQDDTGIAEQDGTDQPDQDGTSIAEQDGTDQPDQDEV